jgi:hypothetical protein
MEGWCGLHGRILPYHHIRIDVHARCSPIKSSAGWANRVPALAAHTDASCRGCMHAHLTTMGGLRFVRITIHKQSTQELPRPQPHKQHRMRLTHARMLLIQVLQVPAVMTQIAKANPDWKYSQVQPTDTECTRYHQENYLTIRKVTAHKERCKAALQHLPHQQQPC